MKTYLISKKVFFIIVLFTNVMFSQGTPNKSVLDITSLISLDLTHKDVVGSCYISEAFLPAKITDSDVVNLLRYNVYQDEMEIEKNNTIYFLSKAVYYAVNFINEKKTYELFDYFENNKNKKGFFVVLFSSEHVSLLLHEKIRLMSEVKVKSGYDEYKPPTLKRSKDKLYIGYKNNSTAELPSKKKDFIKLFSSNSKKIETYLSENKLNIKKIDDLISIFTYYNTLQ